MVDMKRLIAMGVLGKKNIELNIACPSITPTIVTELLTNGGFETFTDGLADSWTKSGTPTTTQETTIINAGSSSQKIVANSGGVYQAKTLSVNKWYSVSLSLYADAGSCYLYFSNGGNLEGQGANKTDASWTTYTVTGKPRLNATDGPWARVNAASSTVYADGASLAELSLPSLMAKLGTRTGNFIVNCNPVVETNTQAGIIVRYLDASNYVIVFVNRAASTVDIVKRVSGAFTRLLSGTITYVSGAKLSVLVNGNNIEAIYNTVPVGLTQTISDTLGNDIYGFSSYASNSIGTVTTSPYREISGGDRPLVLFTFDDGHTTVYTEGFGYLTTKNVGGVAYQIGNALGISTAQMLEMDADGWDIANHTSDHTNLTTLNQAQCQTKLLDCKNTLNGLGLTKASRHVAYPTGLRNATSDAAMLAEGMLTGRTTVGSLSFNCFTVNKYQIPATTLASATTLAAAEALIDDIVAKKLVQCFYGHRLETPATDITWTVADFQALVDYAIAAGCQIVSMTELSTIAGW